MEDVDALDLAKESWLVIDGNHRIHFWQEMGYPEIPVRVLCAYSKKHRTKITNTMMLQLARTEHNVNEAHMPFSMYN